MESADSQYLASLAHELNSQPLPILPETFELLRLPPPHQRLGEVNFQIEPHAELSYDSDGEEDISSESDDEEADSEVDRENGAEEEAEAEDEDMEEVGVQTTSARQERQVDEDYDE